MTTDKFKEAYGLMKEIAKAKKELNEFIVPESEKYPIIFLENEYSCINIRVNGNGSNHRRTIKISKEMAKFFYYQELNRLQAKVHHLNTKFSKL